MAWTDPRTWTTNELVTAAIMNTHVRDNLNASAPHLIVRKTSDQSVTSSTVLVNDTALVLPVLANEVWHFRFVLRYDAGTVGDLKMTWSIPTASRVEAASIFQNSGGTLALITWDMTTSDAVVQPFVGAGAGTTLVPVITGFYTGGANAGNVTLRWAQNTSDGTATKMLTNSSLFAVKLA